MFESSEPLTEFFGQMLPAAQRAGYKIVATLLAREADAQAVYSDIERYWSSLHDLTGEHVLFVLGAKNAGTKFPATGLREWREPVLHCSPHAAIQGRRALYWRGEGHRFSERIVSDLHRGNHSPSDRLARSHSMEITSLRRYFGVGEESTPALIFVVLDQINELNAITVPLATIEPTTVYGYLKKVISLLDPAFFEAETLFTALKNARQRLHESESKREFARVPLSLMEREFLAFSESYPAGAAAIRAITELCKAKPEGIVSKRRCFDLLRDVASNAGSHSGIVIRLQSYIDRSFHRNAGRAETPHADKESLKREIDANERQLKDIWRDIRSVLKVATRPDGRPVGLPWDFFIAYSSKDGWYADGLFRALSKHSSVFVDRFCLRPGDIWPKRLREEHDNSRSTVLLISRNTEDAWFATSEYLHAIELARGSNHRVIPVLIGEDMKLPYGLEQIHAIRTSSSIRFDSLAKDISDSCCAPPLPISINDETVLGTITITGL